MKTIEIVRRFKTELTVYRRVLLDPRLPPSARWLLAGAIGYLATPVDLVPDFIPILGHLDDLVVIPILVYLATQRIPPEIIAQHRADVAAEAAAAKTA